MKKILSILVMVLFGVGIMWAQNTHYLSVYAIVDGECEASTTGGLVSVQGSQAGKNWLGSVNGINLTTQTTEDKQHENVSIQEYTKTSILGTTTYYTQYKLYATPAEGYYFAGWRINSCNGEVVYVSEVQHVELTSLLGTTPQYLKYYAVFKPKIEDVPNEITSQTQLNLYTGTDVYQEGHTTYGKYPYSPKRKIDLSAAFNNGVAAFDQLFIFGLTTNNDASTVTISGVTGPKITTPARTTNSNAVTPCYIYTKSGENYLLASIIDNVNIATKPTVFNITANGQKVYFTGYAPYVSCGYTWDENGIFCFTGNANSIDLYMDNLQIYARPKAEVGNVVNKLPIVAEGFDDLGMLDQDYIDPNINILNLASSSVTVYTRGSGSAFCFISKSKTAFTPNIHVRGENLLESTSGMSVQVKVLTLVNSTASQQSSPIQVLLYDKSYSKTAKTTLTIDDVWYSGRTNGILHLDNTPSRACPTIDLGSANTTLNINGGQLFLSNSYNSSREYFVSYSISHRLKSLMDGLGCIYALGDDQPTGAVHITDGSINCQPLSTSYLNSRPDLYHNTTSLKCPKNTIVDGGTFNCDIVACSASSSMGCSPKNSQGKYLCKYTIPITDNLIKNNGTALLPSDWRDIARSQGSTVGETDSYGAESLMPDVLESGEKYVYIMLPMGDKFCFYEVITTPWVMCFPSMTVKVSGGSKNLGGDQAVPYTASLDKTADPPTILKTTKLFYGEIDQFLYKSLSSYEIPDMTITISDPTSKVVTNTSDYMVYDKIYMLKPLVANQWEMFVPPFDVANIYVVESYPEAKLLEKYGVETTNKIGEKVNVITGDNIAVAREEQAHRMIDFIYQWVWSSVALKKDADLWPTTGSAPANFVKSWMDMYDTDKPIIEQLYHYTFEGRDNYPTGKSCWDANFYLYEVDATNNNWAVVDGKIDAKWKEVPTVSLPRDTKGTKKHNVIMKQGGVYALSFPSTIQNNNVHDYMNTWDYWTGKYIILEGYSNPNTTIDFDADGEVDDVGQLLKGSNASGDVLQSYSTPNSVALRGNKTFSKMGLETLSNSFVLNNYYWGTEGGSVLDPTYKHNVYVSAQGQGVELNPAQGFILANLPTRNGMRARAIDIQTGDVTYEPVDGSENGATSTPTISGEREMLVYTVAGGLGVVPVTPQYVYIYNTAGQLVVSQYLTDNTQFALPTGIYLVRGEKDQAKAMVK